MTRVAVVGAGAWGTTLACAAHCAAPRRPCGRGSPRSSRRSSRGAKTSRSCLASRCRRALRVTGDLPEAIADADLVVFAVPAQHLRSLIDIDRRRRSTRAERREGTRSRAHACG